MFKYEYYEVVQRIKNLPFSSGDFIKGYKLGDQCELGGYATKEQAEAELKRITDKFGLQGFVVRQVDYKLIEATCV